MKSRVLIIIAALCSSCGLGQLEVGVHSSSDGIWRGPSYGKYLSGTVYAVGIDYPDGYDWKSDVENGTVRSSLVMFADGIPVLKIPVGDGCEVSSDNSRHRVLAGCLYTDYTDGKMTVLKKDGTDIVRYEGAEDILCMAIYDGSVHFLTSRRGEGGFVYRVDGRIVLERNEGTPYLHLDEYADSIRFCFSQNQKISSGQEQRYYQVVGGVVRRVDVSENVSKVWDMRVSDGKVCLVGSLAEGGLVMICDGESTGLNGIPVRDVVSCSFCDTDRMCVKIRRRHSGNNLMSDVIWLDNGETVMYRIGRTLSSVFVDEDGCNAVMNPMNERDGLIFCGSRANLIPQGYSVYSKDCMVRKDSVLYVGLSSDGCGPPVIWRDGIPDTLKINGPLTCLR